MISIFHHALWLRVEGGEMCAGRHGGRVELNCSASLPV